MKTKSRVFHLTLALAGLLGYAAIAAAQQNPVGVFVTVSTSAVNEGQTFQVTVQANAPPANPMTVNVGFFLGGPGQPMPADFDITLFGVTLSPIQTSRTYTITALADGVYEGTEVLEIRVSPSGDVFPPYRPVDPTNAFVTIFNLDPPPVVAFTNGASSVAESGSRAVDVRLSRASVSNVTVNWSSPGAGTATFGADYSTSPSGPGGTLTFQPGETNKTITVFPVNDVLDEADETVRLTLSSPTGGTLGSPSQHDVTILDDDTAPTVGFTSAATARLESGGTVSLQVNLSAPSGRTVAVNWSVGAASTATAGADYNLSPAGTSGTLTFLPGDTSETLSVQLLNDTAAENDETVILNLAAPVNATLGTSAHTVTIQDDDVNIFWARTSVTNSEADGFATFEVRLSRTLSFALQVQLTTVSHTATAGEDFTAPPTSLSIPAGQPGVFISVPLINDALNELLEIAEFRLSNPTSGQITGQASAELRITDDESLPTISFAPFSLLNPGLVQFNENAGQIYLVVTLSRPSGRAVWCTVSVQGSTATIFEDFVFDALPNQFLVINEGETNVEFSLTLTDDALFEAREDIVLTLVSLNGVTPGTRTSGIIRIQDNDAAPTASFGNFSTSFGEATTAPTIPVVLSAPAGTPVKVNVAVTGGTATGGGVDFTLNSGTVYFEPGETSKHVNLTCVNDSLDEPTETINLTLSPGSLFTFPPDGYTGIGVAGILNRTFDIVDDDPAPQVSFGFNNFTMSEGVITATGTDVLLDRPSSQTVTVQIRVTGGTASNGVDYTISPLSLSFAPLETNKALVVYFIEDTLAEGDESITLALASPIAATLGANATQVLWILDDDALAATPEHPLGLGTNPGHRVRFRKAAPAADIYSINSAEALLALPLPNAEVAFEVNDDGVTAINYVDASTDPVPQGYFGGDRDFHSVPGTPTFAAGNIDDFAMSASGYLYAPEPGNWVFTVRSDDGFRLRIGSNDTIVAEYVDGRAPGDSIAVVNIPRTGYYRYDLTYFENFGGAQIEFLVRPPQTSGVGLLVGDPNSPMRVFRDLDIPPVVRPVSEPFFPGAAGHQVEFRKSSFNLTDVPVAQSLLGLPVSDARVLAVASDHGISVINYDDASGSPGFFAADRQIATPPMSASKGSFSAAADDNFAMRASGFIQVTNPGVWSFVTYSDDGFQLRLGTNQQVVSAHLAPRGPAATTNRVNLPVAGFYPYELIFFEWGGGALVEFFAFGPGQPTSRLVGDPNGVLRVYQTGLSEVRLTITKSGNQAILRWPSAATGFTLERCSAFAGASTVWTPVSGSPSVVGQFWQQTDNLSGTARCYRLRRP